MSRLAIMNDHSFYNKKLLNGILDLYLEDDPELIVIIDSQIANLLGPAEEWAYNNDVDVVLHFHNWNIFSNTSPEAFLTEIWCDADEGLLFWDGSEDKREEIEVSMDISKRQQKTLTVLLSNDEIDCEIYDEW